MSVDGITVKGMFAVELIALSEAGKALLSGGAGAVGAALVAGGFGLYRIASGRKDAERDRRRDLYSEAYKAALQWCEGLYRVRRRASDGSEDRELVKHFHDLQERISYYEGWISMETPELGRSYRQLLKKVRGECEPLIQEAWDKDGREPTQPAPEAEVRPDLSEPKAVFVGDVREHLSRRPWKRRAVKKRYPEESL